MIPETYEIKALWDKYNLPKDKRRHCTLVAKVARFLAKKCAEKGVQRSVNEKLLVAAALLHDIDKNVPKLPGEQHPDTAVRLLEKEGMAEVADLVRAHPLHVILDQSLSPKTWEEKLLYLSDKMVKYEILTVDQRFSLWQKESLPAEARALLSAAYPKVKQLEKEIFSLIGVSPPDVRRLADQIKIDIY